MESYIAISKSIMTNFLKIITSSSLDSFLLFFEKLPLLFGDKKLLIAKQNLWTTNIRRQNVPTCKYYKVQLWSFSNYFILVLYLTLMCTDLELPYDLIAIINAHTGTNDVSIEIEAITHLIKPVVWTVTDIRVCSYFHTGSNIAHVSL